MCNAPQLGKGNSDPLGLFPGRKSKGASARAREVGGRTNARGVWQATSCGNKPYTVLAPRRIRPITGTRTVLPKSYHATQSQVKQIALGVAFPSSFGGGNGFEYE